MTAGIAVERRDVPAPTRSSRPTRSTSSPTSIAGSTTSGSCCSRRATSARRSFDAGILPDFPAATADVRAANGQLPRRRGTSTTAGSRSPARPSAR